MSEQTYQYVIVGGGLAGASAVQGIRELDKKGSILLVCGEKHLPYNRPPLSKKLWLGKKKVEDIFVHDRKFYEDNEVQMVLGSRVVDVKPGPRTVTDEGGRSYRWEKLLLATGGVPRRLAIPGGDADGICYYRSLDDYQRIRDESTEGRSAVVIGGGFIGSEMAAALSIIKLNVTMIFPGEYLVARVFPESLGRAIEEQYRARGVEIITGDVPVSLDRTDGRFVTRTRGGRRIESDLVVAGIGIDPELRLAAIAGVEMGDGIVVNQYLQTSNPDVFAAGDNASFPQAVLGRRRVEHWDNALVQGACAGRNMAGAHEPYTHLPYFFSDLFEFGYEAVGEVNSRLETCADWQDENKTGVIYYLRDGRIHGAMMCNVWDKVDAARELLRGGRTVARDDLRGAI
jgi:3-phenylpropionate/trans-cinnamate dioxygenase ferredoxin reductase component